MDMKCPVCGFELNYDAVDIGVGTQFGNYRCDKCGWNEQEENEKYLNHMGFIEESYADKE